MKSFEHHSMKLLLCLALAGVFAACSQEREVREPAPEDEPPERLVLKGDALIESQADLDEMARYAEIGGRLVLKRAKVKEVSLPLLESVGGKVSVRKNADLVSFSAPVLKSVGRSGVDDMTFESNPVLRRIELPKLETVAHSVVIRNNGALEEIEMPALVQAPGDGLEVSANGKLSRLSLPVLRAATHVTVSDCGKLKDVSMESLEWTDSLRVERNGSLTGLAMPLLGIINHDPEVNPVRVEVRITDNPALKSLGGLGNLSMIGRNGALVISGNTSLPSCQALDIEKRLTEKGWRGKATICGNAGDECGHKECEERDSD